MDLGRIFGAVLGGAAAPPRRRRSTRNAFGLTQTESRQIGRALGALAGVAAEALAKSRSPAPAPPPVTRAPAGTGPIPPVRRVPEIGPAPPPAAPPPSAEGAETRLMLRAMIAAAKADGVLDREERAAIASQLDAAGLSGPERDQVLADMENPATPEELARGVRDPMLAAQVYAAAVLAAGEISPAERAWLDRLGRALKLDAAALAAIESRLGG